jgi:hypothetical protein
MAAKKPVTTQPVPDMPAWRALQAHYVATGAHLDMRELFAADPQRFAKLRCGLWWWGGFFFSFPPFTVPAAERWRWARAGMSCCLTLASIW